MDPRTNDEMHEAAERRIVDLEIRFMRAEKMLTELSDVLITHQKTIDRLEGETMRLRERLSEGGGEPIGNDRPPHY